MNKLIRLHRTCNQSLRLCSTTSASDWDYDIVVSGCGIVSASFINKLLYKSNISKPFKICIIDPIDRSKQSPNPTSIPSSRVYALSTGSIEFLKSINIWDKIKLTNRLQPFKQMYVWESFGPGKVSFNSKDIQVDQLGYIVEENVILQALVDELTNYSIIDYKFGYIISDLKVNHIDENTVGPANITITNLLDKTTSKLTTRLVVGGDGATSTVRKLSNISTIGWSYGQEALIATVQVDNSDKNANTAYQKYLPTGPLAMLPLWDNYKGIVWSLPVSEAKRISQLSNDEIIELINKSLNNNKLADDWNNKPNNIIYDIANTFKILSDPVDIPPRVISISTPIQSFPLQFQTATSYYSNRVVLLGDSAHSIHPQAGQGLNLGLSDSRVLSTVISDCIQSGGDIGDRNVLIKYHKIQYYNNLSMLLNVDMINTLFSEDKAKSPYLLHLSTSLQDNVNINKIKSVYYFIRSFGMLSINSFQIIRSYIMKYAMGL